MTDFERARRAMVDNQLRTSSITDRRLLGIMGEVPRERFVPEERQALAYIDDVHLFGPGTGARGLAAPAEFAALVQLAEIGAGDKVLDVGCGAGYSTAVLAGLAAEVVAVEGDAALVAAARDNLAALGITNAILVEAATDAGAPTHGPYDVIVVEGAVDTVPPALLALLKDGGRLAVAIRSGATIVANLFVRSGRDVAARAAFDINLPPLAAVKAAPAFVF